MKTPPGASRGAAPAKEFEDLRELSVYRNLVWLKNLFHDFKNGVCKPFATHGLPLMDAGTSPRRFTGNLPGRRAAVPNRQRKPGHPVQAVNRHQVEPQHWYALNGDAPSVAFCWPTKIALAREQSLVARCITRLEPPRYFVPFNFVPSIFYVALQQINRGNGTQRFT